MRESLLQADPAHSVSPWQWTSSLIRNNEKLLIGMPDHLLDTTPTVDKSLTRL